ncbi:MAG: hypothetical protein ACFB0D_02040 [Phormidesmis sp.]
MERVALSIDDAIALGLWTGSIADYMPESTYKRPTALVELLKLKSQQSDDKTAQTLLSKLSGKKELETPKQCEKWLNSMSLAPSSFNRYRGCIHSVRPDLIEGIARKKGIKGKPDPFTLDEQKLLNNLFSKSKYEHLFKFWLLCGFRNGELKALLFSDFQQDRGKYFVSVSKSKVGDVIKPMPKNKKARKVYLSERNFRLFRAPYQQKEDLYGDIGWSNFVKYQWQPLQREAGVRVRKPYCLRHTAISNYIHDGGNSADAAYTFGTSIRVIEEHYLGLVDTPKLV